MIYQKIVQLDGVELAYYDNALEKQLDLGIRPGNVSFLKIVKFANGFTADVKVVNAKEDGCYCEMVLLDRNGSELAYTEIHNALSGTFEITWKDDTYRVDVCAA